MLTFSLTSTKGFFFLFFPPLKKVEFWSQRPQPFISLSIRVAVASFRRENRKASFFPDITINLSRRHQFQLTVPQR